MSRPLAAVLAATLWSAVLPAATLSGKVTLIDKGAARADASNVVVWIEGARRGSGVAHGEMKSSSKRFLPRVIAISKNGTVDFPNADPIYHNVFSVSGGNRFDLGLYRSGTTKSKRFEEPGLVRIYCNIHPQMVGFVVVADSDYLAVTGPDGTFRFEGVPEGRHVVKAWYEQGPEASETVHVGSAADPPLALRIDVSGFAPAPHKNKYGKDYPPNAGEADDERY
jgi:plastocyanin